MADAPLTAALRHVRRLTGADSSAAQTDDDLLHAFLALCDQEAFAALVRRHGPMVLNVCRRVLRNHQDAEDAFQATFVVLARKAATVGNRQALAGWLHGAAYRAARAIERSLARRRAHEARVRPRDTEAPSAELAWREVEAILEEEIQRLPEKYRMVFVLCCLEGHGRADVARQLGLPEGTVWSRLNHARELLRRNLTRRGVSLSAVLAAAALTQPASASVPPALVAATTDAVASGSVSASVAEAMSQTALARVKVVAALLLTAGAIAGSAWVFGLPAAGPPPKTTEAAAAARVDRHGDPLPVGAVARLGTVRFRHGSWAWGVAWSPDGKRVASASHDRNIRVWDAATGKEVQRLTGHGDNVRTVAYTPDGKHLISSGGTLYRDSPDVSVRLWDAATGKEVRRLLDAGPVTAKAQKVFVGVALSPDGKMLSATNVDGLFLVEVPTGRRLGVLKGPEMRRLRAACFRPDGKAIAATFDDSVALLDVAALRWVWVLTEETSSKAFPYAAELAFSPDGQTLVVADGTSPMRVIDVGSGKAIRLVGGKDELHAPVCYTRDGKKLFANTRYGPPSLWDVATWKPALDFGRLPYTHDGALSPDGKTLATASMQSILLWDVATGKPLAAPAGLAAEAEGLAISPDGSTAVTTDRGNAALVWDLPTGKLRAALAGLKWPQGPAFSADGQLIFIGGGDAPIVFDAATGALVRRCEGREGRNIEAVACSPGGRLLVGITPHQGPEVFAWDVRTGKELPLLATLPEHGGRANVLAFSPEGKLLATGGQDGAVRLWDVAARKAERRFLDESRNVWGVAFSADGRRLAAASGKDGEKPAIRTWDVKSGEEVRKPQSLPAGSRCFAWSADGRVVATGGDDALVRVWELTTGQERLQLRGHQGAVVSLGFTPAGRLVSGSYDTTALVWDLAEAARPAAPPRDEELPKLWEDMAGGAGSAYRAVAGYQRAGDRVVRWLEKRLKPAEVPPGAKLAALIRELDSDTFATRQKARGELEALGELALPALEKALTAGPSAEVRRQAERLMRAASGMSPGGLREARAVEALEGIGTPSARRVLQSLAAGAEGARLTREATAALARVAARR